MDMQKKQIEAKEIEKLNIFLKAVHETCIISDKIYTFTCPICNKEAQAVKCGSNGHHHAQCPTCNIRFME